MDDYESGDLTRVLDVDGAVVDEDRVPDLSDEQFRRMYRDMRFSRRFDTRMVSLQRQGRLGTYAPLAGQEGSQIGSTYALRDDEWILYQYREHGAVVARGIDYRYILYWMGNEIGNAAVTENYVFPLNISIASQLPHAVGMAWASKLKGEDDRAFVCHFGDGASSEGDFHEALNFAGVFDTPNVFVLNNNQWAISVPRERQTASATYAQKARAYGFEGVRVDGMDPLAVYNVTKEAAEKARDPGPEERRPTLIEAVQYRFGAHTTADDPTVYREEAEVERWKQYDPIDRLERFLRDTGRLDDEAVDAMASEIEDRMDEMVERAEAFDPDPEEMFEHAYDRMPPEVERQLAEFRRLREEHGDEAFLRE